MIERTVRIPPVDLANLSPEDRAVVEKAAVTPGVVDNIFRVMGNNPTLLRRWLVFASHILAKQSVPPREREIAILRIGWLNQAEYEWAQHVVIAKRAGVTDEEIAQIQTGAGASGWSADDRAVVQAVDDLFERHVVGDATWAALSQRWSTEQLMDLIFTIGQYNLVSWALNSFGVQLDSHLTGFDA
jgi:4-carboxymuconolactone decarboxylase